MFGLKPMRELISEYIKDPKLIKSLVKNVILYTYGGFNFRQLLLNGNERNFIELLNSFKQVNIYESFYATGEFNSINCDVFPKLHE